MIRPVTAAALRGPYSRGMFNMLLEARYETKIEALEEELAQARLWGSEMDQLCLRAKRGLDRLQQRHNRFIAMVLSTLDGLKNAAYSFRDLSDLAESSLNQNGEHGSELFSSEETKVKNSRMPSPAGMLDTPKKRRRRKANTGSPTRTGRPRARTSKASTPKAAKTVPSAAKSPRRSRSPAGKPRKRNDRRLAERASSKVPVERQVHSPRKPERRHIAR